MSSVKRRLIRTAVKYLITHPRSRVTRFVVRFALRKLGQKITTSPGVAAIPAVRGSRLASVAGVALVAGTIILLVRRGKGSGEASAVTVPPAHAPFPAAAPAAAPPETRDAPPTSPTTSSAAEAAAADVGGDEESLVARVEAKLFEGAPPLGVEIEANAGVITLRGKVADDDAERRFVRDAEQVEGVKAVQSELQSGADEPGSPAS